LSISYFGSKYFGWLIGLAIVIGAGWFLLPEGYNTLVLWLAPTLGNYTRPIFVLLNAVLVNPLNNLTMVAIWAVAGLVGGMFAGTKKGAFVVGLVIWLTCILALGFLVIQLFFGGSFSLSSIPPMPQGTSIADLLGIPLIQSLIDQAFIILGGFGGGGFGGLDIFGIITPMLVWFIAPLVIVIVAGMIGATIRKKE
jgi:hypothetical protein